MSLGNKIGLGIGAVVGLLIVITIIASIVDSKPGDNTTSAQPVAMPKGPTLEEKKTSAKYVAQQCVERELKSPKSAEFPYEKEAYSILHLNGDTFMVTSYVDAQNSYGALLRSNYVSVVRIDDKGDGYCIGTTLIQR